MRRNLLVIAAALLGAATLPAAAQIKMDMNKITCQDMLGYNTADRTFLQYWMSGWYSYQTSTPWIDFIQYRQNIANVKAWCTRYPNEKIMTGLNKATGTQ